MVRWRRPKGQEHEEPSEPFTVDVSVDPGTRDWKLVTQGDSGLVLTCCQIPGDRDARIQEACRAVRQLLENPTKATTYGIIVPKLAPNPGDAVLMSVRCQPKERGGNVVSFPFSYRTGERIPDLALSEPEVCQFEDQAWESLGAHADLNRFQESLEAAGIPRSLWRFCESKATLDALRQAAKDGLAPERMRYLVLSPYDRQSATIISSALSSHWENGLSELEGLDSLDGGQVLEACKGFNAGLTAQQVASYAKPAVPSYRMAEERQRLQSSKRRKSRAR